MKTFVEPVGNECRVHFANGDVMHLQFRHFCGGTSIKLPKLMADFRKQWVLYTPRGIDRDAMVGRRFIAKIVFPKAQE